MEVQGADGKDTPVTLANTNSRQLPIWDEGRSFWFEIQFSHVSENLPSRPNPERLPIMHAEAATQKRRDEISRLKQQISEALELADALALPLVAIKLSESIDCTESALMSVQIGPSPSLCKAVSD